MGKIDSFSLYWDYDIEGSKVCTISEKGIFYKVMLEMVFKINIYIFSHFYNKFTFLTDNIKKTQLHHRAFNNDYQIQG